MLLTIVSVHFIGYTCIFINYSLSFVRKAFLRMYFSGFR